VRTGRTRSSKGALEEEAIMAIRRTVSLAVLMLASGMAPAVADMAAAEKWVNDEFQPSTLSKADQLKEMEWFINRAKPFAGMEVNVLSETIPTHEYESKVLTKAFEEITGIKVNHQLLGEGEVVQAVQTQMQTNRNLYDAYINDSDLIGTHSRLQSAVNLTDWMAGEGKDVTDPMLDIDDFIGKSFTTGPDGKLWQLPDQQFANLYWFRKDWFDRKDLKAAFKKKYGYELGVPVNWSAYEDIAEFFTVDVKEVDGVKGLWPHGLRQARARSRLAHDRRVAVDGGRRLAGPAERPSDRRVGHPDGRGFLQPGRRLGVARRRDQRPGLGLRDRQVGRVAAQIRASGRCRLRLLSVAAGPQPGQRGPADLLVHRLHRLDGGPEVRRQQHGRRQRQSAVADGAVAARPVLEGRPEARLSGLPAPGLCSSRPRSRTARRPGSTPSSSSPRRST
jgi:hypothetical protein